ncbi:putative serine/threonine-protein kinase PIX13, partial [Drosera capensis]
TFTPCSAAVSAVDSRHRLKARGEISGAKRKERRVFLVILHYVRDKRTSVVASSEAGFSGRSNSCSSAGNSSFGGGSEGFEERDGAGDFGRVYKGSVDDKGSRSGGKIVAAIKRLNSESFQVYAEWQLLGYCWEDMELLLVYEYMAKGSLENHLFRKLQYKVIRFWPSAKLGPSDENVTTGVMGTCGYAAPEYVATVDFILSFGHLYVKSDVHGFGVVLLELLTGLRAVDVNRPSGQVNLVESAKPRLSSKRKLRGIMDGKIEGQYSDKYTFETARLTLHSLGTEPKSRPSMKEVVNVL